MLILGTDNYRIQKRSAARRAAPGRAAAGVCADRHPGTKPRISRARDPSNHVDDAGANLGVKVLEQLLLLLDEIVRDPLT
jgi:hypothetical protein